MTRMDVCSSSMTTRVGRLARYDHPDRHSHRDRRLGGVLWYPLMKRVDARGVRTTAFLYHGAAYLHVLYQASPAIVVEQQRDTRTVTIPRQMAENALVEEYKERLHDMSDGDIAGLFEEEIVAKRSRGSSASARSSTRDFPTEDILGSSNVMSSAQEEQSADAPYVKDTDIKDETAMLLRGKEGAYASPSNDDAQNKGQYDLGLLKGIMGSDRLLEWATRRSKDLAVPIMGAGALVLGVALLYTRLVSMFSHGNTYAENGGRDRQGTSSDVMLDGQGQQESSIDRNSDPYTRYTASAGTGEILWKRQEQNDEIHLNKQQVSSRKNEGDEDPWRTPMQGVMMEDSPDMVGPDTRVPIENKRPKTSINQILDNAESISTSLPGKRHSSFHTESGNETSSNM